MAGHAKVEAGQLRRGDVIRDREGRTHTIAAASQPCVCDYYDPAAGGVVALPSMRVFTEEEPNGRTAPIGALYDVTNR